MSWFSRRRKSRSNSSFTTLSSKKLRLEPLEQKIVLAGNVTAAIVGGDLMITGDIADNEFEILRTGPGVGELKVAGRAGTLINGMAEEDFGMVPITGDVIIDFSLGGDNGAFVGDTDQAPSDILQLPGDISVTGGGARDALIMEDTNVGNVSMTDSAGGLSAINFFSAVTVTGSVTLESDNAVSEMLLFESIVSGDVSQTPLAGGVATDGAAFRLDGTSVGGTATFESDADSTSTVVNDSFVAGDLNITTGDGTDTVVALTTAFPTFNNEVVGDLNISTGNGADSVMIDSLTVGDDLRIWTGSDGIVVDAASLDVGDDLSFSGGSGADVFLLQPSTALNSIGDDLYVSTRGGDDSVTIVGAAIDDKLRIGTAAGDDQVVVAEATVGRSTVVTMGDGINFAGMADVDSGRSLTILGRGENVIDLAGVSTTHFITIVTASGSDTIVMNTVTTSSALIATKAGEDNVSIDSSTFDYLFALLGSGDDTLTLSGVTVTRFAFLHGGSGEDELVDVGDNDINFELDFSFELP